MKKITIFLIAFLCVWKLDAQNLDRIAISSGGMSTDVVNYVIGEVFNFTMASGGNITIETGTLGSTVNTGGLHNGTKIEEVAELKKVACYPNPAIDAIYFTINDKSQTSLFVNVFDITGKLLISETTQNMDIMKLDLQPVSQGTYIATISNSKNEVLGSFKFVKQ